MRTLTHKLASEIRPGDRIAEGSTVVRIKGAREAGQAHVFVLRDEDGEEWRAPIRPTDRVAMWDGAL